eukprot:1361059-Pleurochrysis_carterae.AAC.1
MPKRTHTHMRGSNARTLAHPKTHTRKEASACARTYAYSILESPNDFTGAHTQAPRAHARACASSRLSVSIASLSASCRRRAAAVAAHAGCAAAHAAASADAKGACASYIWRSRKSVAE